MQKYQKGQRIGLILSTINNRSALNLCHSIIQQSSKDKNTVFIFTGGKIYPQTNPEYHRNSIYTLANSINLDGLISWSSDINGAVSNSDTETFHSTFHNLPLVTIGHKITGIPCTTFDIYKGMKEFILHLIENHGIKKLAFLRGPENDFQAEEAFRGFNDALEENHLYTENSQNLITSPLSWNCGEKGISQLCDERNLIPGKDFEALIGAGDSLVLDALSYLKRRTFRIPKDLLAGGFGNTEESRIYTPSLSTVKVPYADLGITAYTKLCHKDKQDTCLQTLPLIRESCGCNQSKIWNNSELKTKVKTQEQLYEQFLEAFPSSHGKVKVRNMFKALYDSDKSKFYDLFNQWLTSYYEEDGDTLNIFSFLSSLRTVSDLQSEYIEKIIRHIVVSIPRIQERVLIQKQVETQKINAVISALKNELLIVFNHKKLISTLRHYLEQISITTCAIVVYEDENYSNYIGGYNSSGIIRTEQVHFPRENIVPERYTQDFSAGSFIVQPMFDEDRAYGYLIFNYVKKDDLLQGFIYEDLRSAISAAMQSIIFYESTNESRKIAEQAEFAKTEFFANVGSDLYDPLKTLSSKLLQIEENIKNGILDKEILEEQILFLRSQIDAQCKKTGILVELTRSQIDDIPMDKKLFDIRQVLPGSIAASLSKNFPLLYGDVERLKRAIQTIFDFSEKLPYISEKQDGLHIEFYSNKFEWQKPQLLLAEKIILLQFGDIEKSTNYAEVVLPWPTFSGLPSEHINHEKTILYCFSNNTYENKFGLQAKNIFDGRGPEKNMESALLYWEPDSAPIDEWIKIYGLRKRESFFNTPIICYSHNLLGHSFIEMLEQKIRSQRASPVLFIESKQTHYGNWATDSNTVTISSIDEFDSILDEIIPSLIVFEKINPNGIRKIRHHKKTATTPVLILPDNITNEKELEEICTFPHVIICNKGAVDSDQFNERIKAILKGDEILPPHTGALVKKAIFYLNANASKQIVRWELADSVHVSEDYLTRIFHKELGLNLWDYLTRYRIFLATKLLLETKKSILEIAESTGFQDQAYFCRVFKRIYGMPPGKMRAKH